MSLEDRSPASVRWLTRDLPGTGGAFAPTVDDFRVEEVPLYEPAGEGEHLYLRVEKRGLTTKELLRRAERVLGVPEIDVGYAGLKDKAATTVQWISLRAVRPEDAGKLEGDGVRVLEARAHRNKLRVGHLAGNRFRLVVHGVGEGALGRARAILDFLGERGLPNFYGAQRFGVAGENAAAGRELLRRGGKGVPHWKAKLFVSALQSALFNEVLRRRMDGGTFARVLAGDVLQKVESGGLFNCSEPEVDQPRHDRFEVSITGPIFGAETRAAEGEPGVLEASVLEAAELRREDWKRIAKLAPGTRRALRARVSEVELAQEGDALVVAFRLPSGAYATVLADELVKPEEPIEEKD